MLTSTAIDDPWACYGAFRRKRPTPFLATGLWVHVVTWWAIKPVGFDTINTKRGDRPGIVIIVRLDFDWWQLVSVVAMGCMTAWWSDTKQSDRLGRWHQVDEVRIAFRTLKSAYYNVSSSYAVWRTYAREVLLRNESVTVLQRSACRRS